MKIHHKMGVLRIALPLGTVGALTLHLLSDVTNSLLFVFRQRGWCPPALAEVTY